MHPTSSKRPLRAYGDREGDGMVQLSFVLELPPSARAREAAKRFAEMHGLGEPIVATMEACAEGFVLLRRLRPLAARGRRRVDRSRRGAYRSADARRDRAARVDPARSKIVVVGACTGSDAHTVGIDAILNYKGYAGDKGLESYKGFEVHNLGAQVENEHSPLAPGPFTPTRSS